LSASGSDIRIPEAELSFEFMRSSGPGGQNVNKVETAVRLLFDVGQSSSITDEVRARLMRLAGRKMGKDGILRIQARRFRTQEANRRDALERLSELIKRASTAPKVRRKTRPPRSVNERRLEYKRRASRIKEKRRRPDMEGTL